MLKRITPPVDDGIQSSSLSLDVTENVVDYDEKHTLIIEGQESPLYVISLPPEKHLKRSESNLDRLDGLWVVAARLVLRVATQL